MLGKIHDPWLTTAPHSLPDIAQFSDQSAAALDVTADYFAHAVNSLPISRNAYELLMFLIPKPQADSAIAGNWFKLYTELGMLTVSIDADFFEPEAKTALVSQDVDVARLSEKLHIAFEMDQIESGMDHPAEIIILEALARAPHACVLEWLRGFSLNVADPSFASSVLRCLGRLDSPGTTSWRAALVRDALALDDVEIRDAAAQAADSWADPDLIEVLTAHKESEQWLRSYIEQITADLEEICDVPGS